MDWDLLVKGGLVLDGHGDAPRIEDVAIAGGRIAARGASLPIERAATVIDATGLWVTPGLIDVHTHYDLEVELDPRLPESLRHGTTTVVMSNCSLGLAFGNQRHTGADPIVDCFARVENLPKSVLAKAGDVATWRTPAAYLAHLDTLPLGPNVVPMIPHTMLRIEVMGLDAAVTRDPTPDELQRMAELLEGGLRDGYAGFSTDALPFHYLANDPHRRRKIPTQYATYAELKRLTDVVRAYGRVWQTTPPKDDPIASLRNFLLSSGRLFGRPLKITAVAAMQVVPNRWLLPLAKLVTTIVGALGGDLRFQALPARFKVWSDGAVTPLAEEVPPLRELNEPDLEDRDARVRIASDSAWQARFRAWWTAPRRPLSKAWLKRLLRYEDTQFDRDLRAMTIDRSPVPAWHDETMRVVRARLLRWQRTGQGARDAVEAEAFAAFPPSPDEAGFLIHLFRTYDTDLSWWTIAANPDEDAVARVLRDERFLPGFADSGAHLSNMAFHDVALRALRLAAREGLTSTSRMVQRLTQEPASFFGLDVGTLDVGAPADLVVLDPAALALHDGEARTERVYREALGTEQLVVRSDGVVRHVVIGGQRAWDGHFTDALGRAPMGRCLRGPPLEAVALAAK